MPSRKVKVLIPVVPPGYETAVLVRNAQGVEQRGIRHDICKAADVIEIDEDDLRARFPHVPQGYVERFIAQGVFAPASPADRVTKKPNYGAYENAGSGKEEPNPIPAKAQP